MNHELIIIKYFDIWLKMLNNFFHSVKSARSRSQYSNWLSVGMLWRQDKEEVMERIIIEPGYEREAKQCVGSHCLLTCSSIKHIVWPNPQSVLSAEHQESFLQWADRSFSMWVLSVGVQSLMDSPRGGEMKCHPYWRTTIDMLQSITSSTWAETFTSF